MKVQFLKEFSFIIEKDGEEVPVVKVNFIPGEAFITKDEGTVPFLQFRNKYNCDWIKQVCYMLNYDAQKQNCFPGINKMFHYDDGDINHILSLIDWNYNPAELKLRINGLPLHKVEFFEF